MCPCPKCSWVATSSDGDATWRWIKEINVLPLLGKCEQGQDHYFPGTGDSRDREGAIQILSAAFPCCLPVDEHLCPTSQGKKAPKIFSAGALSQSRVETLLRSPLGVIPLEADVLGLHGCNPQQPLPGTLQAPSVYLKVIYQTPTTPETWQWANPVVPLPKHSNRTQKRGESTKNHPLFQIGTNGSILTPKMFETTQGQKNCF